MTKNDLEKLGEMIGRNIKIATDAATLPMIARIGQLESEVATLRALVHSKIVEPR